MSVFKRLFGGGPNSTEVSEYLALAEKVAALNPDPDHVRRVRQTITADLVRSWNRKQFDTAMETMRTTYTILSDPIQREEVYTLTALCIRCAEEIAQQRPFSKDAMDAAQNYRHMAAQHMVTLSREERQQMIRELSALVK